MPLYLLLRARLARSLLMRSLLVRPLLARSFEIFPKVKICNGRFHLKSIFRFFP